MAAGNFARPILEKPSFITNNNDIGTYLTLRTTDNPKKQQKLLEKQLFFLLIRAFKWGYSSVGRAFAWHAKGQEFESP